MQFATDTANELVPHVLSQILDTCMNGITLADPNIEDNPIVYANEAFELITGFNAEEIVGRNCRFLHGEDREQEGLEKVRDAIKNKTSVTVTLRNYRKDGEMFYNRFTVRPLFDRDGQLIYFLGLQYDVTNQLQAEEELTRLNRLIEKAK